MLCGLVVAVLDVQARAAQAAGEAQVKAVFLFNFAHFIDWPPRQPDAALPFVISVAGAAELLPLLEEAVRGESVQGRPLQVRPLAPGTEADFGQVLFIGQSGASQLTQLLGQVARTGTLTVSDIPDAVRRGVMIEMVNDRNRIRLRINLAAARAAGLSISSNLLRAAEIIDGAGA